MNVLTVKQACTADHLEALRTSGEIAFRRPWGRLVVAMQLEAAR